MKLSGALVRNVLGLSLAFLLIAPGYVYAQSSPYVVTASEQAGIYGNDPNNNFNGYYVITAQWDPFGAHASDATAIFLKFPGVLDSTFAVIDSAKITMETYHSSASIQTMVRRVLGSWDETTITWNNAPSWSTSDTTTIYPAATNYTPFTSTLNPELIQAMKDAGVNYGLVLTGVNDGNYFETRDDGTVDTPVLTIWSHDPASSQASRRLGLPSGVYVGTRPNGATGPGLALGVRGSH